MPVITPFSHNSSSIAESIQTLDALPVLKAATNSSVRDIKELTAKLSAVDLPTIVNAMVQMETLTSIASVDQSQVAAAKNNLSVKINQALTEIIGVGNVSNSGNAGNGN